MESFARKAHVIFLAEDSAQHLGDLAVRIARLAPRPPILSLVTPVPVGTASGVEKRLKQEKLRGTVVSQPVFFTPGCAVEDFNWPDRIIMGTSSNDAVDRKSTRLNSSHLVISYAVFCLKKTTS